MIFRPSTEIRISQSESVAQDSARRRLHGIAERLQPGERLLWHGAPHWSTLAIEAFHVRKVAVYFGALALWYLVDAYSEANPFAVALTQIAWLALGAVLACALLMFLARLAARTTLYVITDRRVAIRCGMALPITVNLPFAHIEAVDLRLRGQNIGDIALVLQPSTRVAYLHLWPHARPWRWSRPQPLLRAIPNADAVARSLAEVMHARTGGVMQPAVRPANGDVPRPDANGRAVPADVAPAL